MTGSEEEARLIINVNNGGQSRGKTAFDQVWILAAASILLLCVGGGVGIGLLGRAFSKACSENVCALARQYEGCFAPMPMVGVCLIVFLSPLGIYGFATLISSFANRVHHYGRKFVLATLSAMALTSLVINICTWVFLLKPTTVYEGRPDGSNENDPLLVLIGGFLMIVFTALFVANAIVLYQLSKPRTMPLSYSTPFLTPRNFRANAKAYAAAMLLFVLAALSNATFSSVWNYSAKSYFPAQSPYAVVQVEASPKFYFKLYADTIVYYGFMGFIATVGLLVHTFPSIRKLLQSRIIIPKPLTKYFVGGYSLGEGLLGLAVIILYVYWVWFWRWGYDRIWKETGAAEGMPNACCNFTTPPVANNSCVFVADEHRDLQAWARVLGHMTSLTLSLLILPVARNSLWDYVFGIPFERALFCHRVLGVVAWTLLTVHMILWYVKWGIEKTLVNNLFTLDYLQITPTNIHYDNFTIILNEITWVFVTVMVFIALFKRRDNYKLFYYSHQFAIIFYIVAIWHAWTFWYYAVGGLILWLIDRCIRIVRRSQHVVVTNRSVFPNIGVTSLTLEKSNFSFYPGQYAWLCIPSISEYDWHPFTISSAPSSCEITFHIKSMGPGTFTQQLLDLPPSVAPEVRFDGPYGRPLYFDECSHVILVAGGIGITPMKSILSEISFRANSNANIGKIKSVKLVWAAREKELFHVLADLLHSTQKNDSGVEISIELYHTQDQVAESTPGGPVSAGEELVDLYLHQGRPDLHAISANFPSGNSTMMMVCGPEGLIMNASSVALEYDFLFHHEVFNF